MTNTYSSGSLHRRVRRMLILCIAVVVLLATSVGLGISLHQEVRTRDQLLSNAAQMAADEIGSVSAMPTMTDTRMPMTSGACSVAHMMRVPT
mgnify:CR=1 FL=1